MRPGYVLVLRCIQAWVVTCEKGSSGGACSLLGDAVRAALLGSHLLLPSLCRPSSGPPPPPIQMSHGSFQAKSQAPCVPFSLTIHYVRTVFSFPPSSLVKAASEEGRGAFRGTQGMFSSLCIALRHGRRLRSRAEVVRWGRLPGGSCWQLLQNASREVVT